jgi:hypothetical protein
MGIMNKIYESRYIDSISGQINQATAKGYPLDQIVPGNVSLSMDEIKEFAQKPKESKKQQDTTKVVDKQDSVVIREKKTGKMKRVSTDSAKQILSNPDYEEVK